MRFLGCAAVPIGGEVGSAELWNLGVEDSHSGMSHTSFKDVEPYI